MKSFFKDVFYRKFLGGPDFCYDASVGDKIVLRLNKNISNSQKNKFIHSVLSSGEGLSINNNYSPLPNDNFPYALVFDGNPKRRANLEAFHNAMHALNPRCTIGYGGLSN